MQVEPLLVLDENDFKPFLDAFKKQLKSDKPLRITGIVPVCLPADDKGNVLWRVEIKTAFTA